MKRAVLTVVAVFAIAIAGTSSVYAEHPKPDPQPSHGTDCDNGNPWGGNHDHCEGGPTSSPSSEPSTTPSVAPSTSPSATPPNDPAPTSSPTPTTSPSVTPTPTASPVVESQPAPTQPTMTAPPTDTETTPPEQQAPGPFFLVGGMLLFIALVGYEYSEFNKHRK